MARKRSAFTMSMNRELSRTFLGLSWQVIPLDFIQGKYPVIKPSVRALDLSNALLGRGNKMILCIAGNRTQVAGRKGIVFLPI